MGGEKIMRPRIKPNTFSLVVIVVLAIFVLTSIPGSRQPKSDSITKATGLAFATQAASGGNYDKYDVIANLAPGVNVRNVARNHNLPIVKNLSDNIYLFRIQNSDSRTVEDVVAELSADPDVVWAEPNYFVDLPELSGLDQRSTAFIDQRSTAFIDGSSPADYFGQYAIVLVEATAAHLVATGVGVTVAVIDTGIDASHPVFANVAPGYDVVNYDSNPVEEGTGSGYGHGTLVAGVVALVAPQATIMPIRAFTSDGVATASNVANAIRWATDNGADVINMSFGMTDESGAVQAAINYASSRGVVLVAAAGNQDTSVPQYPASDPNVLAVAATDQYDAKADFSNYGSHVAVSAPGVSIYSAYPGGAWAWWSGTSFAAPFVSGEAALLLSIGRSPSQIQSTATPLSGSGLGSGRIDCLAAVSL
jgi:thermitase